MTKLLQNKVALITGAGRGIGAAVAKRFVQEGAKVICLSRQEEHLEKLDDEIHALGGEAILLPFDLSHAEKIPQIAHAIHERFGGLDILVGNAGVFGQLCPTGDMSPSHFNHVFKVNVAANWHLIAALDPMLRAAKAGRAIFTSTGASATDDTIPFWGVYGASKAALNTMIKTYAKEVERTNIKVNLVSPGRVRTDMQAQAFPGEDLSPLPGPDEVTDVYVSLAQENCAHHGEILLARDYMKKAA